MISFVRGTVALTSSDSLVVDLGSVGLAVQCTPGTAMSVRHGEHIELLGGFGEGQRLADLLARKPTRVATVAMANKTARVVWAIMARGETYRTGHQPALAA